MLTEEEAKTKWCPFVRRTYSGIPVNRVADTAEFMDSCPCIASACMAWRWRRRYADDAKEAKISHATGYCGLAGKP